MASKRWRRLRMRWTIGGTMILVAAVAVPLGGYVNYRRSRDLQSAELAMARRAWAEVMVDQANPELLLRSRTLRLQVAAARQGSGAPDDPAHSERPVPLGLAPDPPEAGTYRHLGTWPERPGDRPFKPLVAGTGPR